MPRSAAFAGVAFVVVSATLAAAEPQASMPATTAATDISAQSRAKKRIPHIRVTPRQYRYPYRLYHSPYPVPYDVEYPGPNAKRACVARLVPEARPSGPVIVPRTYCWWVRG